MTPPLILFDGICNFCNGWVNFIIAHDKKNIFRFTPLQSDKGQEQLKQHNLHFTSLDTFVLLEENNHFAKSTAALRVFRKLGGLWQALYLFILIPRFMRDFLYDFIARNRYRWFGKRDICMIPSQEERERFAF